MATNVPSIPSATPATPVAEILARLDRTKLATFAQVAIDILDIMDGDSDFELGGDDEPRRADGDTEDPTYAEWTSLRGKQRGECFWVSDRDDDEEDDFGEDSHDQEAIDEREECSDGDPNIVAPIWPGEGSIEVPLCRQ